MWVENEAGNLDFASVSNKEIAQVKVQYVRIDQGPPTQLTSSTYILGDHKDMLAHAEQASIFDLVARTPWENCLDRLFGLSFQKLMAASNLLGNFLGGVARITNAFATGEAKSAGFDCSNYINFPEASYGKGFLESVTAIFPELDRAPHLKEQMQLAEALSLNEAQDSIEQTLRSLKVICGCLGCAPHKPALEEMDKNSNKNCLVAITAVIKHLVSSLSCVEKDPELQLTVSGVESVYRRQYSSWATSLQREQDLLKVVLDLGRDDHYYMLEDVHTLFRGTDYQSIEKLEQPSPNWHYCTATSQNGIYIYLDALRSLTSRGDLMRKLHVRRGHIHWNDRFYDSVWDAISWSNDISPVVKCEQASNKIPSPALSGDAPKIKAFVTERSSGSRLHFYYRALLPKNETVSLQPGFLTETVLRNTGNLSCSRWSCSNALAFPCTPIQEGWAVDDTTLSRNLHFHAGIACCVWLLGGDDVRRCIAMQLVRNSGKGGSEPLRWESSIFVRKGECLPCCSLEVLKMSDQLLIRSKYAQDPTSVKAVAWIIA